MSRFKSGTKIGVIGLCALLAFGGLRASAAETNYDELEILPGQGLPDPRVPGGWAMPQQSGVTYIGKAKQWMRTPVFQAVGYSINTQQLRDTTCRRITQAPGATAFRQYHAIVTMADRTVPIDSTRRYGFTQSFTVRTTAFGAIPVEATVALEQPRNDKGVVVPLELKQDEIEYCAGQGGFDVPPPAGGQRSRPLTGGGPVRVRVDRVVIDGIALKMSKKCVTDKATLSLTSRDYLNWTVAPEDRLNQSLEAIMRTPYFSILTGGLVLGSLDIPAFANCVTTRGDDISRLLTATVSGEGNAVQIRTEALNSDVLQPGEDILDGCPIKRACADRLPTLDLPTEPPS